MTRHVISHRKPRRKRGGWWSFAFRRFGALAVTVAALGAASWLAPYVYRPLPAPAPVEVAEIPALPPKLPPPAEATKIVIGDATVIQAQRPRRTRSGVPLDARPGQTGEDFEILTASELAAISQARN